MNWKKASGGLLLFLSAFVLFEAPRLFGTPSPSTNLTCEPGGCTTPQGTCTDFFWFDGTTPIDTRLHASQTVGTVGEDSGTFLTAIQSINGHICLGSFTYTLATTYSPVSGLWISGVGSGTIISITASAGGAGQSGAIQLNSVKNVTISDLSLTIAPAVTNSYISLTSASNTLISNIRVNGVAPSSGSPFAAISLYQNSAGTDLNTRILQSSFYGIGSAAIGMQGIFLEATGANTFINNTLIEGNTFQAITSRGIQLLGQSSGYVGWTRIIGNNFFNLLPMTATSGQATAVFGQPTAGTVFHTIVQGNDYESNVAFGTQGKTFAIFQEMNDTELIGNQIRTNPEAPGGPTSTCFAPGQNNPPNVDFGVVIIGNTCQGFNSFWDPNSMEYVTVSGNIVKDCSSVLAGGLNVGYGFQMFETITNNIFVNCAGFGDASHIGAISIDNIGPDNSIIVANNVIVDNQTSPNINFFLAVSSGSFDSSKVVIQNNYVYVPNGAVTYTFLGASATPPRFVRGNTISANGAFLLPLKLTNFVGSQGSMPANSIGPYGTSGTVVASTAYTIYGADLTFTCSGGTGTSLTIAEAGSNLVSGVSCASVATNGDVYTLHIGDTLNFGAFSVAPTVIMNIAS